MNKYEYFKYLLDKKNFDSESFDEIEIEDVIFIDCNLEMTTFYGAKFTNCTFERCDFYGAILTEAKFLSSNLLSVDFSGASLNETIFTNSNIEKCEFGLNSFGRAATISGANFSKAKITDCIFNKTIISEKTIFPDEFNFSDFDFILKN